MGGGIALLVAILLERDEKRLSSLVLIDTVAFPKKLPFLFQLLRLPLLGRLILSILPPKVTARVVLAIAFHDRSKITSEMVEHYAENLRANGGANALASTIEQMMPSNIDELITKYDTISVPTLILWGHDDRLVPLENGKKLADKIKNSVFEEIPNCGHVPQEEQPGSVIGHINDFLQSSASPNAKATGPLRRGARLEGTRP
jgi:pimeloyl-ACP methyl ester carboxylesterase